MRFTEVMERYERRASATLLGEEDRSRRWTREEMLEAAREWHRRYRGWPRARDWRGGTAPVVAGDGSRSYRKAPEAFGSPGGGHRGAFPSSRAVWGVWDSWRSFIDEARGMS